jgi:hypothetical protein
MPYIFIYFIWMPVSYSAVGLSAKENIIYFNQWFFSIRDLIVINSMMRMIKSRMTSVILY